MPRTFEERIRADGLPGGIFDRTFGATVTRYPLGNTTQPQPVRAIVQMDLETAPGQAGGGVAVQTIDSEKIIRTAILEVTELQETSDQDTWLLPNYDPINPTAVWQTVRPDAPGRDPGMKSVWLERHEPIATSRFKSSRR